MKIRFSWVVFILFIQSVSSQIKGTNSIQKFDSLFSISVQEGSFPGLAVSYCSSDTCWNATYGVKESGTNKQVDENTLFQLGSLGKIFTAIAVLQSVEDERLDLDEDISKYTSLELNRFDDSRITLRNLLTHSAGMNDRNIGYFARDQFSLESLEEHLTYNLPSFYQPPGLEINYSNYSYALAGYIVEVASGESFDKYVEQNIFKVLGIDDSFIGFDFDYYRNPKYAIGHNKTAVGFESNREYARHAIPAGSLISSSTDMNKLLKAMLQRDTLILNQSSWNLLFTRQFSNDPQLGGYSLGLEEQFYEGQKYWAKGGMLTGYLSQVIFWPDSTAMFIATNTNDDSFLENFHKIFKERLSENEIKSTIQKEVNLSKYTGEYRNARYDREGVENLISLFRGAFEVWEGDSSLLAWHNGEIHHYDYIGNHVFQNRNDVDVKMVFVEEEGRVVKLYRDVNIGGLSVPSTFGKTQWYNSPSFINEYYGIAPLGILLYSISILGVIAMSIVRKWKPGFGKGKLLPPVYHFIAGVGILAVVLHIIQVFIPMVKAPMELLFGLSEQIQLFNKLTLLIIAMSIILWLLLIQALVSKKGRAISRIMFLLFTLLMSAHSWFLIYWSFF